MSLATEQFVFYALLESMFETFFIFLFPLIVIGALQDTQIFANNSSNLDQSDQPLLIDKYKNIIIAGVFIIFTALSVFNYYKISNFEPKKAKTINIVNNFDKKINNISNLQYAQFLSKLKSGQFKTYQKVYDLNQNKKIRIFTTQNGKKYHPLMIRNAENNSNLSKYYKNITILKSFNKNSYKETNGTKFSYFCHNKKAFQDFFNKKLPKTHCSLLKHKLEFFLF